MKKASPIATRPEAAPPKKARGRPRSFDREAALNAAMEVFWTKGYESASISDLTAAMGINPPSLYAAFGDKEKLFLATSSITRRRTVTSFARSNPRPGRPSRATCASRRTS